MGAVAPRVHRACTVAAVGGQTPVKHPKLHTPKQPRQTQKTEEVAEAVGGGYCRLQMPLKLALAVTETGAGHALGTLGGGGRRVPPPFQCIFWARGRDKTGETVFRDWVRSQKW